MLEVCHFLYQICVCCWVGSVVEQLGAFLAEMKLVFPQAFWCSVATYVHCSDAGACVENLSATSLTLFSLVQPCLSLYAFLPGLNPVQSAC